MSTLQARVAQLRKDLEDGVLVTKEDTACLVFDLAGVIESRSMVADAMLSLAVETPLKQPHEVGIKHDTTKPDFSLLSPIALTYLASVLSFGAEKYAPNNWRKGIDKPRLLSASLRHLMAISAGLYVDEETGLPHSAHLMCCAMFMCELESSDVYTDSTFPLSEGQQDLLVSLLADWKSGKVPPLSDL